MRSSKLSAVCLILATCACCGCDSLIYRTGSVDVPSLTIEWETSDDEARYSWPFDGRRYVVTKPPPMAYLTSFSTKFSLDEKFDAPLVPWDDLDLCPTAQEFMNSAYLQKEAEIDPVLTLPIEELAGPLSFDISDDGRRLVTLQDDSVVLYNAESGKRVGAMDLPSEWKGDAPIAVRFCGKESDFMLASSSQICRLSGKSGKVVAQSDGCGEKLIDWQAASERGLMAFLTDQGSLFVGDQDLTYLRRLNRKGQTFTDIGISELGDGVVVCGEPNPVRLVIDDGYEVDRDVVENIVLEPDAKATGGWYSVGWINGSQIAYISKRQSDSGELQDIANSMSTYWRPHLLASFRPLGENFNSFLVASRRLVGDRLEWVLFALGANGRNHTSPIILNRRPDRMLVSDDGGAVVLLDSEGLSLVRREGYRSPFGLFLTIDCRKLLGNESIEEFEKLFAAIGRQERFSCGMWPSEIQTILISDAASFWRYMIGNRDQLNDEQKRTLDEFEAWRKEGGSLAQTVFAICNRDIAWAARGNGLSYTVSQNQWELFEKHNRIAEELLAAVAESDEKPPAAALRSLIQARLDLGADFAEIDAIARRFTQLYPGNDSVASTIGVKLLPQWGGEPGDIVSLIEAHSRMFSGDYSDIAYAKLAGRMCRNWIDENLLDVKNTNYRRVLNGMRLLHEKGQPLGGFGWYGYNLVRHLGSREEGDEAARLLMVHLAAMPDRSTLPAWHVMTRSDSFDELFEEAERREARGAEGR